MLLETLQQFFCLLQPAVGVQNACRQTVSEHQPQAEEGESAAETVCSSASGAGTADRGRNDIDYGAAAAFATHQVDPRCGAAVDAKLPLSAWSERHRGLPV